MDDNYTGTVFYASKDAQRKRYVREGQHGTFRGYHSALEIEPDFIQIDFDSTGTNYIHLALDKYDADTVHQEYSEMMRG